MPAVTEQDFSFSVHIYCSVYVSTLPSREHFMASREDCRRTTKRYKNHKLSRTYSQNFTPFHLTPCVQRKPSWSKRCDLSFHFAFSTIDCSSPARMDSLMQLTVSFLALMSFCRLDIWWVVAGVQRGEFRPLCSDLFQIPPSNMLSVERSLHC